MDKRIDSGIGLRLREIRTSAGLSQKFFGSVLGVSLPTVNRIENGQRHPDAELLIKVRREYGCDVNWLLTGKTSEPREGKESFPLLKKLDRSLTNPPADSVSDVLTVPDAPEGAVACRSKDDACAPRVNERDTVIFVPGDCIVGDLVVVCDEWGNGFIRTKQTKNEKFVYVADHQGYGQMSDEVTCLGRVWGVIKKIAK